MKLTALLDDLPAGRKEDFSIGFEMPLGDWEIRNATHLPGDYVLSQLGRDQICLLDPMRKRIAIIARGRGPVAVLGE